MKRLSPFFALLCLLAMALPAQAQLTFNVLGTDGRNYPDIGITFEALDASNNSIQSFSPTDFTVVENGIVRPVISVSCPPPVTPPISVTFTFDISFSMTIDARLQNMKNASSQLINDLSYPPAASAVTTFGDNTTIVLPYTNNKTDILNTVAGLTASGGGTDFIGAFLNPVSGAIDVTKNRSGDRYIIFMTDAFENLTAAQENSIITAAKAANIRVFTVTVSPNTVNYNLRRIAQQTGGQWFENVITIESAKAIFKEIGDQIFIYQPCTLIYRTDGCDTERNIAVTLRKNGRTVTRNTSVSVPVANLAWLDVSNSLLDFGVVNGGQTKNDNVVITSRGITINVTSITSAESAFRITGYGGSAPPFTLGPGQSRTISIQYRPVNTDRLVTPLKIVCDAPCQETVVLSGGVYDPAPMKLILPNGGESMFSGTTFRWAWSGISGTQAAELEYSTNSGSTWTSITNNAYNYTYNWRVPTTPSEECLGLALTKEERITSLDGLWTGEQPAAVNAVAVAESGTLTAAALANGQVKIFYPKDAAFVTLIDAHTGSANTVAFSPDMRWLATGGSDARVRIWDTRNGSMAKELSGPSGAVHTVRFTADGNYLVAGSAGNVILWRVWDWSLAWTHNGDTGNDGALAVSPHTDFIASGAGNNISILDFTTGNRLRQLTGHTGAVRSLDISNDGFVIVSGSEDRSVRMWNAISWQEMRALNGHGGAVRSVQLSNAAGRVLSGSSDNSVRIWDGRNGSLLYTLTGHSGNVNGAVFDRRTRYIISGGADERIRVWGYVPPVADKSDSLWTIVQTVTDLQGDPPQFDPLKCPDTWSDSEALFHNTGNQLVNILSARITGADSSAFAFASGYSIPPTVLMQPEDTLLIPIRFFPARIGDFDAVLEIETDIPGSPVVTLPLSGRKDTVRTVVTPDTLDAGELYSCALPVTLTFMLANEGSVNAVIDSIDTDIPGIVSFPSVFPRILFPGQIDTVEVLVHPSAIGPFEGFVRMETTPCGYTEDIVIRGNMVPTAIVAEPNPLIFDFAAVGDTTYGQFVLRNTTMVPMVLDSTALLFSNPPFALLDNFLLPDTNGVYDSLLALTSILLPDTLQPGDSLVMHFAYFPQNEGGSNGQMYFHTNAPCDDSLFVGLQASSSRKPAIAHTATTFSNLLCPDEQSSSATATLRNTGGLPLTVSELRKAGANPGDFQIIGPAVPLVIPPGGTEVVQLEFLPQAKGSLRSFILEVVSDAENEPLVQIPYSARKDSVGMSVSPGAIDLGERYICEFPQTLEFTYRNHGTVDMDLTVDTTAAIVPGFGIVPRTWPVRIAPGAEFVLELTLLPPTGAYGNYQTQISATAPLCGTFFLVPVSYSYAPHVADISPLSIDFGTLGFGGSSTGSVTVTNPQGSPMKVHITKPSGPEISVTSPATTDTTLAPGESLTISLRMDAMSSGDISDMLTIGTLQVCDDTVFIPLSGRIEAATAALTLPNLEAEIGSRVVIPLTLTAATNLAITGTQSFEADIVFNRSILWPESITASNGSVTMTQVAENGDLRLKLNAQQTATPTAGMQAELTCLVMLGNDDQTPLRLENFRWLNGTAATTTTSGSLIVRGICEEGGKRLVALPAGLTLFQNNPNPFNPTTEITFSTPDDGDARLVVIDMLGRTVATLLDEKVTKGEHRATFDASGKAAGTYTAMLLFNGEARTIQMVLVK
ncbi:MAG: choice-of-anchor D domain-containing protein [Bacteroidetes bacterium]|nr:choice-of-anchor D domain-containing protein [Bacteroidota bacterium]